MRTWILGIALIAGFILPVAVHAETQCVCFCGTAQEGAKQLGGTYTANGCIDTCREDGKEPVGCYIREDQYPENSEICWTKEQCEGGTQAGMGNVWENEVYDCDDDKEKMGHCYAGPKSITTIISINGDNTFSGLADYIDALYRYLVPVMAIVAIVMVMIAGLQYILSRGNPSAVKEAKARISNAVIGLVLLLSAYTLARLLDPRLVEFEQLRIPKIKQVVTLSEGSKCATLAMAGMEIDDVPAAKFEDKTCTFEEGGAKGVVTDISEVKDEVDIGNWKEGDFCNYSKCDPGATCMSTGCAVCSDIAFHSMTSVDTTDVEESEVNDPSATTLYPSPNNCALISDEDGGTNGDKQFCIYTEGGFPSESTSSFPSWWLGTQFPASCVNVPINCAVVQSLAQAWKAANADVCGVYGKLEEEQVSNPLQTLNTVDFTIGTVEVEDYATVDPDIYETICNDDPCGIGALQGKTCTFTPSTVICAGR